MNIYQGIAIGLVVIAVAWDLATRRIPNLLTFGAALAAFAVHAYVEGWTGAGTSLAGWVVGAAFFFPFFALRGMGAGDVKLLAAVGAWLGPAAIVWVALFSGVAGGVFGLVVAALSGYLNKAFANLYGLLGYWRLAGIRPAPELMLSTSGRPAFGVCGSRPRRTDGDVMVAMNSVTGRLRSERGAELIEFALVFPILLLVVLGIVDFGFLFQRMEVVTNAAREGARIAVLPGYATGDVQARVQNYVQTGGLPTTTAPLNPVIQSPT